MTVCPGVRKGLSFFTPFIKQLFGNKGDDKSERRRMALDIEAVERVEAKLDAFISKRAREKAEANRTEETWRASERRHRHELRVANGHAWIEYFDYLALCHENRAAEYKDKSRGVAEMVHALEGEPTGEGVAANEGMPGN